MPARQRASFIGIPALCWLLQTIGAVPALADASESILQLNRPITTQHRAADSSRYAAQISANRTYLLEITQQDIDLIIDVTYPDGRTRSFNSPLYRKEDETLLVQTVRNGPMTIVVRSDEITDTLVGHTVSLREVASTGQMQERRLDAWRLTTSAAEKNSAGGARNWADAFDEYSTAAGEWRRIGDAAMAARSLYCAAMISYEGLYDYDRALEAALDSESLYRAAGKEQLAVDVSRLRAATLLEIAALGNQGNDDEDPESPDRLFDEAISIFQEARRYHEPLDHTYDTAQIINNIGLAYYYRGEWESAERYWSDALSLFRAGGERQAEMLSLNNLALIDDWRGDFIKAIDKYGAVLTAMPADRTSLVRGLAQLNMGSAYRKLGNTNAALRAFSEVTAYMPEENFVYRSAVAGLGETYYGAGQLELADSHFEQALDLARRYNDGRLQVHALRYLGDVAYVGGEYNAALQAHEQALALATAEPERLRLRVLIANDLCAVGRPDEALELATGLVATADDLGSPRLVADAYAAVGRAQLLMGRIEAALDNYSNGLEIAERIGMTIHRAEMSRMLARALAEADDLQQALIIGDQAIGIVEDMRGMVADPELRGFFLAGRHFYYEQQISLLMHAWNESGRGDAHYVVRAFETAERARARVTSDLIRENSAGLEFDADPELQQRRGRQIDRLMELRVRRDRIIDRPAGESSSELKEISDEMDRIENDLNVLDSRLRDTSPKYAQLMSRDSANLADIQANLGPDTTLLQYALGDDRSFGWVVTSDSIVVHALPPRSDIDAAVRRVIERVRAPSVSSTDRRAVDAALAELSRLVLAPLTPDLATGRLRVAPDGAMHNVPLGILPLADDGERLLDRFEITHIPSSTAMIAQAGRPGRSVASTKIAVFADPVFEATDSRMSLPATSIDGHATISDIPRLRWTAAEAESIAALVPPDQRFIATGFAASRANLLALDLTQYRILHLATHGLIDSRYPELSAIALSAYDASGRPVDGMLRLADVYSLELATDLTVLSACDTALGLELRGEGLLGLTQGFIAAGNHNLLTSLWRVPDQATAELMERFYRALLTDRHSPSAALRAAQRSLAATRRWREPYYWGAFVLLGDGR